MTTIDLPSGFIESLRAENPGMFDGLESALAETPSTAIRYNTGKMPVPADLTDCVPWCGEGRYLANRPVFTLDPALHQGLYYVQDASSMFISMIARQLSAGEKPLRWLDACAAPGGKTTCVLGALPKGSLVMANEIVPQRAAVLRENILKWGDPSVIVTRGDSRALARLSGRFDVVAADVPCSGEGMMRKDADAVAQWSKKLVTECATLQRGIVSDLWEAVTPGGHMVYSTCTFNRTENEDMLQYIEKQLGGEIVPVEGVDPSWGIVESGGGYRFIPGRIRGEGLFMALIRKPGDAAPWQPGRSINAKPHITNDWLGDHDLTVMTQNDRINAFPSVHMPLLKNVEATRGLDIILHGTIVARIKGRDIIPDHSLALSMALRRGAFPEVELQTDTALSYLRCETITLPTDTPRGHVLLTHGGRPLGFSKHMGNRTNSLFPREWRIHIQR